MNQKFIKLLEKDYVFLDGAMGTELQKRGMKTGENPVMLNFTMPNTVEDIICDYVKAGADIVTLNTFGVNSYKLKDTGKTVEEVVLQAAKIGRAVLEKSASNALLAMDISPIGQLLEPSGTLTFESAYDMFKQQVLAGVKAGVDVIFLQTFSDLLELKAAVLAAKENCGLPVLASMTFEKNGRTFAGVCPSAMALTLEGLGVDALGVNCSLGAAEIAPVIEELAKFTTLPLILKPNAGLPVPETGLFEQSADEFVEQIYKLNKSVKLIGGCCGTSPEYIVKLKEKFTQNNTAKKSCGNRKNIHQSCVCSATKTVNINRPRIIGERINPTGKKLFKEALLNADYDYIIRQAVEQIGAGADILDVNVGLPDIDERAVMVKIIKQLQSITDLPLQIDSGVPEVIEAALRVYNGKAIVNSVNGEDGVLDAILPIVKKYGAAVVGLTLDKNGIPKTAEGRFAIAEKILNKAVEYGIKKEDVFIDCLTLTVCTEQENATETLKALNMVKTKLGLKTVLGVSNISFGLPNREIINSHFLSLALSNGLDLPIINPNIKAMTDTVFTHNLLYNNDKNASEFISRFSVKETFQKSAENAELTLEEAVKNGLKKEASLITGRLLQYMSYMNIVDTMIIPSLDEIGSDFEKGSVFLPQLLMAAGAAQSAFEVIRNYALSTGEKQEYKGEIILATVKGDIHDIGKNIVKLLLQNYSYKVYDLGKDVSPEEVVKATAEHNVTLVGLSALMTTTLPAMEQTIALLKQRKPDCKIMVGGAVLTPEYAVKIGADYYAKDAKEAVNIAKLILSER